MFSNPLTSTKTSPLTHAEPLFSEVRALSPYRSAPAAHSFAPNFFSHSLSAAPATGRQTKTETKTETATARHFGSFLPLSAPPREFRGGKSFFCLWAAHAQCVLHAESRERRMIELERENAFLRAALFESSERRAKTRFEAPAAFAKAPRPRDVLHCIREIERETTRYFETEMERMRKERLMQLGESEKGGGGDVCAAYASVFAEAERRRWKEHLRAAAEEIAQMHRERERRGASNGRNGLGERWSECEKISDRGDMQRTADDELQREKKQKTVAEREKPRGNLYQREGAPEVRGMHTAYQEVFDAQNFIPSVESNLSSTPPPSVSHTAPGLSTDAAKERGEASFGMFASTENEHTSFSLEGGKHLNVANSFGDGVAAGNIGAGEGHRQRRTYHSDDFLRTVNMTTGDNSFSV